MAMMKKKALTQDYFTEGVDEGVDVGGMHVVLGKEDSSWFTKGPCIRVLYAKENISGLSTSLEGVQSHSTIQELLPPHRGPVKQEHGAQKTRGRLELIGEEYALQVQGLPSPATCRFDTYTPEATLPVATKRSEEFDPNTEFVAEVDVV